MEAGWALTGFRYSLRDCLRLLLCVSLQGRLTPRFSSPLGGHLLCQGRDAYCPISANWLSDLSNFRRLYQSHYLKGYVLKTLLFPDGFRLIHPCRLCVNALCIDKKQKEPSPVQAHMGKSAAWFYSTWICLAWRWKVSCWSTGHGESATHMYAHSVKSWVHPTPLNCRPTIFPSESRTQYAEWLCRKNPWQQHIQSLLILFGKISLLIFSFNFLKRYIFLRFTRFKWKKNSAVQFFKRELFLGFMNYLKAIHSSF